MSSRYQLSENHLMRAEQTIPLGSQTFSKSRTQYPVGISPLYAKSAKGAYLWDIDGNRYVDLVSSLASITLGYQDRAVQRAVRKQLNRGSIWSLPGKLESEVSELIVELVPSAELVRFGKNGSDSTSAAIRLARAYTGKNNVAVCGYHGWQDWFIGSTSRNKGVPMEVRGLTQVFEYNNLESLQKLLSSGQNDFAAIILEPMNATWPNDDFLSGVRRLATQYNAVLIFDETITGFRFSSGGAQKYFGVTPDLSTFGKGLANGYPLSAVVGKKEIMSEMENIFYSGTFGGELLSLAAAKSVLQRHKGEGISTNLSCIGEELSMAVQEVISATNMSQTLKLSGHPTWNFLNWTGASEFTVDQIKTFFMQEMFKRGILVLGTHNVTLAHKKSVIRKVVAAYSEVLPKLSENINRGSLVENTKVEPLSPLFRVR